VKDKFNKIKGTQNSKKDWNSQSRNNPKKLSKLEEGLEEILHGMKGGDKDNAKRLGIYQVVFVASY